MGGGRPQQSEAGKDIYSTFIFVGKLIPMSSLGPLGHCPSTATSSSSQQSFFLTQMYFLFVCVLKNMRERGQGSASPRASTEAFFLHTA